MGSGVTENSYRLDTGVQVKLSWAGCGLCYRELLQAGHWSPSKTHVLGMGSGVTENSYRLDTGVQVKLSWAGYGQWCYRELLQAGHWSPSKTVVGWVWAVVLQRTPTGWTLESK